MRRLVFVSGILLLLVISCGKKIPPGAVTETFHVSGNCGMCKKNIEGSLQTDGIYKAKWNKKTKLITVVFDTAVISLSHIQQRIADAGYDNTGYKASNEVYNNLHSCCKYKRE